MRILTLNAGASSLKFALADLQTGVPQISQRGQWADEGSNSRLLVRDQAGTLLEQADWACAATPAGELDHRLSWLLQRFGTPDVVGHRIVHGGAHFHGPCRLDDKALAQLHALEPFAPLHERRNLQAVHWLQTQQTAPIQVGCFDTAFHASLPAHVYHYALPAALRAQGIRRYGFHGLSFQSVLDRLQAEQPALAQGRLVVAHLGAGASVCAIRAGLSIDTSMGLTALDGLPMASRCGALDPGVLLYLLGQGADAGSLTELLYRQSGLLGLSGESGDMQRLLASRQPGAALAIDVFVYRLQREIGAMAAALQGVDGLVFTGGIGEHAAQLRARVCAGLNWLGVVLDDAANAASQPCISLPTSAIRVLVMASDEESVIARQAWQVAQADGP